jgi:O-antigen ligase
MVLKSLKITAGIAYILLFAWLIGSEDLSWVPTIVVLAGICFLVCIRWPYGSLLALILTSAMSHFYIEVHGWKARPEHIVIILFAAMLFLRFAKGKFRVHLSRMDLFLVGYIVLNFVSSGLESPQPSQTLRWALLNALAVLPYFFVRFLVSDKNRMDWTFKVLLGVGIGEAVYALACFVSHQIFRTTFGVEVGQYAGDISGTYGTQWEPNILGSYSGCLAIMLLMYYFLSDRRSRWPLVGLVIALGAMAVALARAAIVGFVAVLLVLMIVGLRKKVLDIGKLIRFAAASLVLVLTVALIAGPYLSDRFRTILVEQPVEDPTTLGRLVAINVAIEDINRHPIIGNGTASLQLLADPNSESILGERPWVSNAPVRVLHDTGTVGLILLGLFFAGITRQAIKASSQKGREARLVSTLLAGCLLYAFSFQATDGTMLAYFWVHMGLLASATACAENWTLESASALQSGVRLQRATALS